MTATLNEITVENFGLLKTADTEDFELVEGELVPLSSGTPLHGMTRDRIARLIGNYFDQRPVGLLIAEIDCRVAERTVRRPDLSIFLGDKASAIDMDKIPVPFAPDIAIEVLSQNETAIDVNRKVLEYLAGGSAEVWLVDHSNCEVFIQSATDIRLFRGENPVESALLPGFSPKVTELLGLAKVS